ncbi:nodulation protein NfeD [Polaromonas sp. SM01]|uniref:NfeD family protein n=1 Tax=Polaromonas sp. SM01 TaxID=3085630 RepID=UPI0029815820|nr:nodulation protein NfeD [Polaromonas sp. SM01]MDW5444606.1 nodulation protein NfeD [Polaromonas sp. SM01]
MLTPAIFRASLIRGPAKWLLCLVLVFWCIGAAAAPVLVLKLQDAIGPASTDYIVRGIAKAQERQAGLVVLMLDTPGGLDSSMRQIIQAMLSSPIPVAVYVAPEGARAASAGTYILYAAHVAAMAPATTLGAATPVAIGLPGAKSDKDKDKAASPTAPTDAMGAKVMNDAAAFIRGLAQTRGRNAEWAERAVREAVSLSAGEALRDKVVDLVAVDLSDLLRQLEGRSVEVRGARITLHTQGQVVEWMLPDWRQRLLAVIAHPSVALILLMVGFYGLVFEFSSPGLALPGVAGAICLLLGLFALQLLPVNYAGLALVLLGMAFLAAELVAPSGLLGAGGVVAFVVGGILLFDRDVPGFGVPLSLVFGLALSSAVVVFVLATMTLRARRRPVLGGHEEMAGTLGEVVYVEGDEAWAEVRGERWRVRSEAPLRTGQRIRVLRIDGLLLQVQGEADFLKGVAS